MLLIAGGQADPNLHALAEAAQALGSPWVDLRVPTGSSPSFHWDLVADPPPGGADRASSAPPLSPPWGDGPPPRGAFIRQDVFAPLGDPRPEVSTRALGWYSAVQGWLLAHPEVRLFNRDITPVPFNKPAALLRARAAGLRVPATWVSNDAARLASRLGEACIAKPVAGGGLCQTLDEALGEASRSPRGQPAFLAMPALVQPRLVAPELRIFVVGAQTFAFEVCSPSLDYRALQDADVQAVPVPSRAAQPLHALMREFRMDFGAADFKTDPDDGELVFLELNTSPMFARFDTACAGALCRAMVEHLSTAA
jgi:hypothetical protein